MKRITIVGASLAGLSAARALRAKGFDGALTVIGDEVRRPYDRPPLSKDFLTGGMSEADLALESDDDDLEAEWLLGLGCPPARYLQRRNRARRRNPDRHRRCGDRDGIAGPQVAGM